MKRKKQILKHPSQSVLTFKHTFWFNTMKNHNWSLIIKVVIMTTLVCCYHFSHNDHVILNHQNQIWELFHKCNSWLTNSEAVLYYKVEKNEGNKLSFFALKSSTKGSVSMFLHICSSLIIRSTNRCYQQGRLLNEQCKYICARTNGGNCVLSLHKEQKKLGNLSTNNKMSSDWRVGRGSAQ